MSFQPKNFTVWVDSFEQPWQTRRHDGKGQAGRWNGGVRNRDHPARAVLLQSGSRRQLHWILFVHRCEELTDFFESSNTCAAVE